MEINSSTTISTRDELQLIEKNGKMYDASILISQMFTNRSRTESLKQDNRLVFFDTYEIGQLWYKSIPYHFMHNDDATDDQ